MIYGDVGAKDHSKAEVERGLENSKSLMLYAGIPNNVDDVEGFKKNGGKIIFFLTPEEKTQYTLKPDEAGITWSTDEGVHNWLLDNVSTWLGGQIGGNTQERASKLATVLYDVVELHNFDIASQKYLATDNTPTRNAFRNYRWYEDGIQLPRAKDKAKDCTGVIIAAGPSLNSQWEHLKRLRERQNMFFYVAGRSYKQAMKMGVVPDMVVEVEQFEWDDAIFMFAPEPPPHMILAGPITTSPPVFHAWPGNKMVLMDHASARMFGLKEDGTESLDGGNSILHHMFNIAVYMGCHTICLAGADLSYPKGSTDTHADGTFHAAWSRNVLVQEHNRQDPREVPCTSGGMVTASQPYKNFCTFLQVQIERARKKRPKLEVINFSPDGQLIKGTTFKDIKTWTPQSSEGSPSSPAPSASSPGPASSPADLSLTRFSSAGTTPASLTFDTKLTRQVVTQPSKSEEKKSSVKAGRKPRSKQRS